MDSVTAMPQAQTATSTAEAFLYQHLTRSAVYRSCPQGYTSGHSVQPVLMAAREHLFCPMSGYMLDLDAKKGAAVCDVSSFSKGLSELSHVQVVLNADMEDYRRRYNLEPIVKSAEEEELAKGRKRATVDEPCPKCNHGQLEFYTMQLRSADEGQTVFYECPNCGHKYSQNN